VNAAAPAATSRRGYHCAECSLTVETSYPGEAEMLAEAHEQVMHNRRVTTRVGQVRVREAVR
jgi:hypothetical protein